MVPGVHDYAADFGSLSHVTGAPGLAEVLVFVVQVGDLADGGHAAQAYTRDFARRKANLSGILFLGEQLSCRAGGTDDLATLAWNQLHVVDRGAERDVGQRQRVPHSCLGFGTGNDYVADLETVRQEHVPLLAVLVEKQANACRPVRSEERRVGKECRS